MSLTEQAIQMALQQGENYAPDFREHPPVPNEPQGWSRGSRWANLLGNIADAGSTIYALQNPNAHEANPLFGEHPSAAKILAVKGAGTLLQQLLFQALAKKGHPKLANILGYTSGGVLGGIAANNIRVGSQK